MGMPNDKVAIVTGASRRIGRGIAERLAKDGASVVVNYTKNAEEAKKKVVTGIEAKGGTAMAVQADTSRVADVRRLFQETQNAYGRLDILINNRSWELCMQLARWQSAHVTGTASTRNMGLCA